MAFAPLIALVVNNRQFMTVTPEKQLRHQLLNACKPVLCWVAAVAELHWSAGQHRQVAALRSATLCWWQLMNKRSSWEMLNSKTAKYDCLYITKIHNWTKNHVQFLILIPVRCSAFFAIAAKLTLALTLTTPFVGLLGWSVKPPELSYNDRVINRISSRPTTFIN
jgi:hypothetical protein